MNSGGVLIANSGYMCYLHEEQITHIELQRQQGLLDYKFMCFGGHVNAVFLDVGVIGNSTGHAEVYYRNVYDRDFQLLPVRETRENYPIRIQKPNRFDEMVKVAECLSKGFPHIRVDLYHIGDQIKVGELTFYHGSGFTNEFSPKEWDKKFGDWITLPK